MELINEIFQISILMLAYSIDLLLISVQLRFCISFFLIINPYFQPFYSLWLFTNPVIWSGRNLYPRIFGIDFTPMINVAIIRYLQRYVDRLVQQIKYYNEVDLKRALRGGELVKNNLNVNTIDSYFEHFNNIINNISINDVIHTIKNSALYIFSLLTIKN